MSRSRLIKHNPAFLSQEELLSAFVVRTRELQLLMEIVRNNTGAVNQHVIIIGPRGMGKTMLVRRLSLEIQRHETLNQNWYPVLLPEEMYDVATEGELWLRVLQWVGEQEKEKDQGRLLKIHDALVTEPNDQTLKIRALASLLEFADRKRMLIIVENLQMLLGEQSSDDDAWDIRQTLLNHPELMLVSTATTHFGEIRNAHKANFELFQEILLPPLDTGACRTLWQSITGEDLTEKRIRPMAILTGGSPRLLAILADFGAGRPLKELMDNLVVLIDDHTTYFKANVESLPNKERRVFVTLAELWEPSRAKDVAERSRLSVNNVSALLNRLVERGAVTKVDQKGRTHYYQITERLYNIYHLMRLSGSTGDRVKALVRCMVPIYGETAVACAMAKESCHVDGDIRTLFIKGYETILGKTQKKKDLMESILKQTPQAFFELPEANYLKTLAKCEMTDESSAAEVFPPIEEKTNFMHKEKFKEAIDAGKWVIEHSSFSEGNQPIELMAAKLVKKGFSLGDMGKHDEAVTTYDSVVERFGSSENETLLMLVAGALSFKGATLEDMGKHDEAMTAYDSVVERFGSSQNETLLVLVAGALSFKGATLEDMGKHDEAVTTYDSVVERFGDSENERLLVLVAKTLVNKAVVLRGMGKHDEAVTAYDSVVERFGSSQNETLLVLVAGALSFKGATLEDMGKHDEAVTTYDSVVERFGDSENERLLVLVAKTLVNKAVVLRGMGKHDEAVTTCDSVAERFGSSKNETLLVAVAMAISLKGATLEIMGKPDEAVTAYDSVVERFGDSENERFLELVAKNLVNKAIALRGMGKHDEAVTIYDSVVERFGSSKNETLLVAVAMVLSLKGATLGIMEKHDEAVTAYDSVVERFGDSENERLLELVANTLVNKAVALGAIGKHDEAVTVYDSVVERFGSSKNERLLELVAKTLGNKANTLTDMGKHDEAVTIYDSVVERFGSSKNETLLVAVAMVLSLKGATLGIMGKHHEAVTAYDRVVERYGSSKNETLLVLVAMALSLKGASLGIMGKHDEAVTAYDNMVERFGASEDERLLEQVAKALVNKAFSLEGMGKHDEAVTAYDSVVERFGDSKNERLLEQVAMAYNQKAWIIYEKKETFKLDAAIQFANDATRLFPDDNAFRHTLACVYGLAGRWAEALEQAGIFANDSEWIKECPGEIIDFFINAAAAGETEASLKMIKRTAAANSLEPLVAALKMSAGVDFHVPKEVMEVASDIVKKIENCRDS